MESERLKALEAEANTLENRLDVMTDKASENYAYVMDRYKEVMRMRTEETNRLLAIEKLKQEEAKLEIEREKIDQDGEIRRLTALNEEEKTKQQKKSNRWQFAGKILEGVVALGVNLVTVYTMVRINNSGETLTSQEQKFIFPKRLK